MTEREVEVPVQIAPGFPPANAIALMVSPAEQAYIDRIREQSYQLALERGHIRR